MAERVNVQRSRENTLHASVSTYNTDVRRWVRV